MARNIGAYYFEQEDKHYLQKIDEASATVTYVGWAEPGTATSVAYWRIKRITVAGTVTTIDWANGNSIFDSEWDERAISVVYS